MRKNIFLIGNPIAGQNGLSKIKKAALLFESKGHVVKTLFTTKKGDAEAFAKEIRNRIEVRDINHKPLIVAAGGDGTYNEVANGLLYSDIPMAILPLGTTSVLAREIGVPKNLNEAVNAAVNGQIRTIHLGRVAYNEPVTNSPAVRCFLLMAGIGFDGEAVYSVNDKIKKYTGKAAYVISGIKSLIKYNPSLFQITCRGQIITAGVDMRTLGFQISESLIDKLVLNAYNAIVCKAACYGGNFKVAPDAKLTEPFFYVFSANGQGRLSILRYILGIIIGRHLKFKDVCYFKTSEIDIIGNGRIQIDGDYLGDLPAKIDIAPDALKLVFIHICPK